MRLRYAKMNSDDSGISELPRKKVLTRKKKKLIKCNVRKDLIQYIQNDIKFNLKPIVHINKMENISSESNSYISDISTSGCSISSTVSSSDLINESPPIQPFAFNLRITASNNSIRKIEPLKALNVPSDDNKSIDDRQEMVCDDSYYEDEDEQEKIKKCWKKSLEENDYQITQVTSKNTVFEEACLDQPDLFEICNKNQLNARCNTFKVPFSNFAKPKNLIVINNPNYKNYNIINSKELCGGGFKELKCKIASNKKKDDTIDSISLYDEAELNRDFQSFIDTYPNNVAHASTSKCAPQSPPKRINIMEKPQEITPKQALMPLFEPPRKVINTQPMFVFTSQKKQISTDESDYETTNNKSWKTMSWLPECVEKSPVPIISTIKSICIRIGNCESSKYNECNYLHKIPSNLELEFERSQIHEVMEVFEYLIKHSNDLLLKQVFPYICNYFKRFEKFKYLLLLIKDIMTLQSHKTAYVKLIINALVQISGFDLSIAIQDIVNQYGHSMMGDTLLEIIISEPHFVDNHWDLIKLLTKSRVNPLSNEIVEKIVQECVNYSYINHTNETLRRLFDDLLFNDIVKVEKINKNLFNDLILQFKNKNMNRQTTFLLDLIEKTPNNNEIKIYANQGNIDYDIDDLLNCVNTTNLNKFIEILRKYSKLNDIRYKLIQKMLTRNLDDFNFMLFELAKDFDFYEVEFKNYIICIAFHMIVERYECWNKKKDKVKEIAIVEEAGRIIISFYDYLPQLLNTNVVHFKGLDKGADKITLIVNVLIRSHYYEKVQNLIKNPDFVLSDNTLSNTKINLALVNEYLKQILENKFLEMAREVIYHIFEIRVERSEKLDIFKHYSVFLKHIINLKSDKSELLKEKEIILKNVKQIAALSPGNIRGILALLYDRMDVENLIFLYNTCCFEGIYTIQDGHENYIMLKRNLIAIEIGIIIKIFFLKVLMYDFAIKEIEIKIGGYCPKLNAITPRMFLDCDQHEDEMAIRAKIEFALKTHFSPPIFLKNRHLVLTIDDCNNIVHSVSRLYGT